MKTTYFTLTVALGGALLLPAAAQEGTRPDAAKPRPTNESLSATTGDGARVYADQIRIRQTAQATEQGLKSSSTILTDGRNWTIVPKGAVLSVPSRLAHRIVSEPTGTLLPWAQFYRRNRGWLHIQNVQLRHARGDEPLMASTIGAYNFTGRLTVAVLAGVPVSVAPEALQNAQPKDRH